MVMRYLQEHDVVDAELTTKSAGMLDRGYKKLVGYETQDKGYEWFGSTPAHEALTAYGLVEFVDMKQVHPEVDDAMIARTADWLKSRRDGKGGYKRDSKALDSFGRADAPVTDAYITWSLTEGGFGDIDKELDRSAEVASKTDDPYLLALTTGTLLNVDARRAAGQKAAARLAGMQAKDGSFPGADHSITRSGGNNLTVETTALAVLALLDAGGHDAEVTQAVSWLNENRGGFGQWGATQATVLSLRAMTAYSEATRKTKASGEGDGQGQRQGRRLVRVRGRAQGRHRVPGARPAPDQRQEPHRAVARQRRAAAVQRRGRVPVDEAGRRASTSWSTSTPAWPRPPSPSARRRASPRRSPTRRRPGSR